MRSRGLRVRAAVQLRQTRGGKTARRVFTVRALLAFLAASTRRRGDPRAGIIRRACRDRRTRGPCGHQLRLPCGVREGCRRCKERRVSVDVIGARFRLPWPRPCSSRSVVRVRRAITRGALVREPQMVLDVRDEEARGARRATAGRGRIRTHRVWQTRITNGAEGCAVAGGQASLQAGRVDSSTCRRPVEHRCSTWNSQRIRQQFSSTWNSE